MTHDVLIIGAGAAGMMAATEAARRGKRVLLIDHATKAGEKIRISGGGRCNFTNLGITADRFLGRNPRFALSALKRFTAWDFIDRINQAGITWHEKTLGQLFCDGSAKQIVDMMLEDMRQAGVELWLSTTTGKVTRKDDGFAVETSRGVQFAQKVIIATGGKSIPKMGATGYGYQIAESFGLAVEELRAGLVPLTFADQELEWIQSLAGLALPIRVSIKDAGKDTGKDTGTSKDSSKGSGKGSGKGANKGAGSKGRFDEAMLFTHRGLSGPAILQISSYWREGDTLSINLCPNIDAAAVLREFKTTNGRSQLSTGLARILPERLARHIAQEIAITAPMAELSGATLDQIAAYLADWPLIPVGSEGYRTAEVTLGGVSTDAIDARTMEAKSVPGLYFIGEVVDITGWLGGYNFQWAWSSGWAAGQAV